MATVSLTNAIIKITTHIRHTLINFEEPLLLAQITLQGAYKHKLPRAHIEYIHTLCFDYRGCFVHSGAPIIQWGEDSNQKHPGTPICFDGTKCEFRSDHYKHNVFEIHEFAQHIECALYVHHKYICACPKHLNRCMSFPSKAPKHYFKKYASDLYQTMKYNICDVLGLRKCACSQ